MGVRSKSMSLAPIQMDPAICGNQVSGLLRKTVATKTGIFRQKRRRNRTEGVRWSGRGGGGMNAISNPKENARMTLVRLNVQQPRSTPKSTNGFKHHSFSST